MDRSVWVKEWVDGKLSIEQQLSNVIASLEIRAQNEIDRKIRWQKEAEEQREREKIERELEARQEKELESFKKLLKDAERWRQTKILREYIEDVKHDVVARNTLTKELDDWLKWASDKADWYDPQIRQEDELLSKVDRDNLVLKKKYTYPAW